MPSPSDRQRHGVAAWVAAGVGGAVGGHENAFYEAGSNAHLAGSLKGKLFLLHGALDDNAHQGNTYAVADALIKANKDFDLLILPNAAHSPGEAEPYFVRRKWDFFVTYLLGMRPPEEYRISAEQGCGDRLAIGFRPGDRGRRRPRAPQVPTVALEFQRQ